MPAVVMRNSHGFNVDYNLQNNNMMMFPSDIVVEQMLNNKIRSSCLNSNYNNNSNNFRPSNSSDRSRMEFGLCQVDNPFGNVYEQIFE